MGTGAGRRSRECAKSYTRQTLRSSKSGSGGGTPIWSHGGIVSTGETYKNVVKMTFAKGAALKDPSGLFNSSLDGNVRRAIDIHEGNKVDEAALKDLIRAAVTLNVLRKPRKTAAVSSAFCKEQRVPLPASGRASASFGLKSKSKPKPRRASSKRAD